MNNNIDRIISRLPPPSQLIPDSLHVMYGDGTKIVVPYLSKETAEKFLRRQRGVTDAFSMYPGFDWKDN